MIHVHRESGLRHGVDPKMTMVPSGTSPVVIGYLREHRITLTWDQAAGTLHAGGTEAIKTSTGKAS